MALGSCNQERSILTIIYCIFGGIVIVVALYMICVFVHHIVNVSKSATSKREKQSKLVISSKIMLFLSIVFSMVMHCVWVLRMCTYSGGGVYGAISTFVYVLQAFLMLITWFIRLYSAFKGTILQIHQATMIIFLSVAITIFIFGVIFGFDRTLIYSDVINEHNWYIVGVILAAIFISLILFLCSLFIYKLVMVYKNLGSDEGFIKLITKITILNFTSIFITIAFIPSLVAYTMGIYGEFVHHFAILINYLSNFICIILSYTYYDKQYNRYCGWMNNRCNACWFRILTGKSIEDKLSKVRSRSPTTTPTTQNLSVDINNGSRNQTPVTNTEDVESYAEDIGGKKDSMEHSGDMIELEDITGNDTRENEGKCKDDEIITMRSFHEYADSTQL